MQDSLEPCFLMEKSASCFATWFFKPSRLLEVRNWSWGRAKADSLSGTFSWKTVLVPFLWACLNSFLNPFCLLPKENSLYYVASFSSEPRSLPSSRLCSLSFPPSKGRNPSPSHATFVEVLSGGLSHKKVIATVGYGERKIIIRRRIKGRRGAVPNWGNR